jgi:hypothetical protein
MRMSITPQLSTDKTMVFLWPRYSETLVERRIDIKYPMEINRKNDPAAP